MVNSSNTDTFTRELKYEWQPWEAGDLNPYSQKIKADQPNNFFKVNPYTHLRKDIRVSNSVPRLFKSKSLLSHILIINFYYSH
jgi:hypothetical protein